METVIVTGADGQLGSELRLVQPQFDSVEFHYLSSEDLDITDEDAIERKLDELGVSMVINCAAYTDVDKAEEDASRADAINAVAVGVLGRLARKMGFKVVHFSTDYIFSGSHTVPYREDSEPDPLNQYGKSKLLGEQFLVASGCEYIILRSAWFFSVFGDNFVKKIYRLASESESINVVSDCRGTPTYTRDLARMVMDVVRLRNDMSWSKIYHFTNQGEASWYGLACKIVEYAGLDCNVLPIASTEYPTKAVRPVYSVLDSTEIAAVMSVEIPTWQDSLSECVLEIVQKRRESALP